MDINKVLHLASEAGRIMLQSGAETYRVEETMIRICNAYNINKAESFVMPTGIMISAESNYDKNMALVKRIRNRTVNLEKISLINDLSRNIKVKGLTMEEFETSLKKIDEIEGYSKKTCIFSSALAAGFFTLVFGGSLLDFMVSLIIGAAIKILCIFLTNLKINDFFVNVAGGATAALIALLCTSIGFGNSKDKIIIGSIMLLVPGLAITNAIRDTISGDLISGVTRAAEAFLVAVGVALGTGAVIKIWFLCFGGTSI